MLSSLNLHAYRAFADFSIEGLKRVSLLVGKNNVGKTSLLEAAEIVASGATPRALFRSLFRRAERIPESENERGLAELDVCHLFHGHALDIGAMIKLSGVNSQPVRLDCEVVWAEAQQRLPFAEETGASVDQVIWNESALSEPLRALRVSHQETNRAVELPLTPRGGLPSNFYYRQLSVDEVSSKPVLSIPTEGLDVRSLGQLWNEIALTEAEGRIISALSIIEEGIERLTYLSSERRPNRGGSADGFFARLKAFPNRIPFGNMGDGMKRLLALSMAVNRAAGGFLLIDEIDTGLHYSTLPDMWRLVVRTAQQLDVQVIATTHSGDCVRALAWLHQNAPNLASDVALHRIERGLKQSIPFDSAELAVAAKRHIEVR